MQPSIKRRTFLQALFGAGALAALWPGATRAQPQYDGLSYSDDSGTTNFAAMSDGDTASGIEYQP